ncbi:hypothetical protein EKD16_04135 [Streptomonospora litoralis]|uniref:Uncharacterized protein n=1 Tax=Streptomonospora litoralis TaxID=2498135 RepID=A0A4P6Q204_9ACTN|nr:hypothetical protein EKD16_04135 [Streptomonospora litoralis]
MARKQSRGSTFRASRGRCVRRGRPQIGHRTPKVHPIGRWSPRRPRPGTTSDVSSPPDLRSGAPPGRSSGRTAPHRAASGLRGPGRNTAAALPSPRARYVRGAGVDRGDRGENPNEGRWISSYGHDRPAALPPSRTHGPLPGTRHPHRPSPGGPLPATGTDTCELGPTAAVAALVARTTGEHPKRWARAQPPPSSALLFRKIARHPADQQGRPAEPTRHRPRCPLLPVNQPAARQGQGQGQVGIAAPSSTARPPMGAGSIQHSFDRA